MDNLITMIPLKNLEIDAPKINLDLEIIQGTTLQLQFDSDKELNIENYSNNDTNVIRFQNKKEDFITSFLGSFISGKDVSCTLTVPPEVKNISIKSTNGDVEISNLKLDYLFTKLTTGDFEMNKCEINKLEQKIITGDLEIYNSKINEIEAKLTTGDFEIKESSINKINISIITGDLYLDSLAKDFNNCCLKLITGDAKILIEGKDSIYIDKKLTPYSSSLKSNIPTINGFGNLRNIEIKATASSIKILGKEIATDKKTEYTSETNNKINLNKNFDETEVMSEEEKKIIDLLKQTKISREFALELLIELGYTKADAESFLKRRNF